MPVMEPHELVHFASICEERVQDDAREKATVEEADRQEAASAKYTSPRVLALSSGRFAIFDRWSQADGLPLLIIVDEHGLAQVIRDYIARPEPVRVSEGDEIDLDDLFKGEV